MVSDSAFSRLICQGIFAHFITRHEPTFGLTPQVDLDSISPLRCTVWTENGRCFVSYCSTCNETASGNFCSKCGAHLSPFTTLTSTQTIDWENEVDLRRLLSNAQVQLMLNVAGERLQGRALPGDQWPFKIGTILPGASSSNNFEETCQRLRYETGQHGTFVYDLPPGRTTVGIMCALNAYGFSVRSIQPLDNGCLLEATLPANLAAVGGGLLMQMEWSRQHSVINAGMRIPDQHWSWSRCERIITELFGFVQCFSQAA